MASNTPHRVVHLSQLMSPHWYHPKSMVYTRVQFGYCTLYGFGQMYTDILRLFNQLVFLLYFFLNERVGEGKVYYSLYLILYNSIVKLIKWTWSAVRSKVNINLQSVIVPTVLLLVGRKTKGNDYFYFSGFYCQISCHFVPCLSLVTQHLNVMILKSLSLTRVFLDT